MVGRRAVLSVVVRDDRMRRSSWGPNYIKWVKPRYIPRVVSLISRYESKFYDSVFGLTGTRQLKHFLIKHFHVRGADFDAAFLWWALKVGAHIHSDGFGGVGPYRKPDSSKWTSSDSFYARQLKKKLGNRRG